MADIALQALIDAALRGTLVALLLVLALVLRRDRPALAAARAGTALCLGLCVQVVSSTPCFEERVPWLWQAPFIALSVANAVVFWLFVCTLFDDDFTWQPAHLAAWLGALAISALSCALGPDHAGGLARAAAVGQRAVPAVFAVLAVRAAVAHWRDDLVEDRRRLRAFIVVTGVVYTVSQLGARLSSPDGRLTGLAASLDVAALLAIIVFVTVRMLRLTATELFPERAPPTTAAAIEAPQAPVGAAPQPGADEPLAAALQALMREQHAYRTENLTVARLAERLAVPEYRLRRLINTQLGHRNFNAYINAFRLEEAQAALADPRRKSQAVLTIALDAGFQSIGPFNRAFKAATGLTPTAFRRAKLADS